MNNDEYCEDVWLKLMPGPSRFINLITESIFESKSIIVRINKNTTWSTETKDAIKQKAKDKSTHNQQFKIIDINFDSENNSKDVGEYILNNYTNKNKFRSTTLKKTIQQYIFNHDDLKNKVFWITCTSNEYEKIWVKFLADYPLENLNSKPCFILEVHNEHEVSKLTEISYEEIITDLDIQLLTNFYLAKEKRLSSLWQNYISIVVSSLCGNNPTLALKLASKADNFKKDDPLKLLSTCDYENQEIRNCQDDALYKNKLWEAQIKFVFPLLELAKLKIITKYDAFIRKELVKVKIPKFAEEGFVTEPFELEYKSLLVDLDIKYLIEEKSLLELLREIRNKLAHIDRPNPDQLNRLFKKIK